MDASKVVRPGLCENFRRPKTFLGSRPAHHVIHAMASNLSANEGYATLHPILDRAEVDLGWPAR